MERMAEVDLTRELDSRATKLSAVLDALHSDGKRIVAITVTWNSANHIDQCLDSIRASSVSVATLVIDNGSTDGTASNVEARANSAEVVVRTGANLGYSGGNNRGIAIATEAGADVCVLLNPDAHVSPNCIEILANTVGSDASIGLVSPVICYQDSNRVWYGGSDIDASTGSTHHLFEGDEWGALPSAPFETGRVSGCVMAFAAMRIREFGYLDERYFLYYEEAEWSLRLRNSGLRIVVVPTAVAWHDAGHGSGGISPVYQYYMTRNRLLLASEYGEFGARGALLSSARATVVNLLGLWKRRDPALAPCMSAIASGYLDFARNRFGPRIERRRFVRRPL
jgi:GT2 family glycosyltransferase